MSIKQWIRNWLNSDKEKLSRVETAEPTVDSTSISINNAINGKVLTLRTYQPSKNNLRSDWVTEHYVIKEGESLTEALTMLLIMRGIDK
jgi:hypothetical protein